MFMIRPAQMEVLARFNDAGTEDRALRHLRKCIPDVCDSLSEAELRRIIRWGRSRSRGHGIEREVDFFRYLNLMFMFGFAFDTDPTYPWAARTLSMDKPSRAKMDLLVDHAMLFCSRNAEARAP